MRKILHFIITNGIRVLIHLCCSVNSRDLHKLPRQGPLIIIINHINFLEVPLIYILLERKYGYTRLSALVKQETWDHPVMGGLARLWRGIPIHRGKVDTQAFRSAFTFLHGNNILVVAPEGTRSHTGRLGRGHPGSAIIAAKTQSTIAPLAHFGGENLYKNLRKLKRTKIEIRVGDAFRVRPGLHIDRQVRRTVTRQMMERLAELLPFQYRGVYQKGPSATEEEYLVPPDYPG
jgi:1-acyl-sn-glycerol-3-phosphate acyltransferase